jgi:hypothetical protein
VSLLDYESRFSNLKMNSHGGGEKSPYKVALLLAVIDLLADDSINENRIHFDNRLKDTFTRHFDNLAEVGDRNNPHLPFFHLRSSGFWHHQVKPGKTDSYANLQTANGPGIILEHIEYAYLDDELFELLGNGVARELLKSALQRNLTPLDRSGLLAVGNGWDWLECEAIVQDYFVMLRDELVGRNFSKAEHGRRLLPLLNGRSISSIEYKHRNISAVLVEMGQPYIQGYKPAFNYQQQLKQVVLAHFAGHPLDLEQISLAADQFLVNDLATVNWANVLDLELPEKLTAISEPERKYMARSTNFSERERNNRQLGERGEAFVIQFERYRLEKAGRPDLAREIQWSSNEQGDGLGYDVRSFNPLREEPMYIEVKTTNSGKYQPFFISSNEVAFSKARANYYSLYRVFDFKNEPRIFQMSGAIEQYVHLTAQSYKASFS